MGTSKRVLGVAIATIALVLTGLGIYFAAADTNPQGLSDNLLALHGRTATSAQIAFSIDTGQSSSITGTLNLDFAHNALSGTLAVPSVFSTTHYGVIVTHGHVYLGAPSLASVIRTPWVSVPTTKNLDLFPVALELSAIKLDLPMLYGLGTHSVSHDGPFTTYTIRRSNIPITLPSTLPLTLPKSLSVTARITTASAGQFSAAVITVRAHHLLVEMKLHVLSYNQPISISPPPARDVQPLSASLLQKIFGANSSMLTLLSPQGLASLSQIRVN